MGINKKFLRAMQHCCQKATCTKTVPEIAEKIRPRFRVGLVQ